MGAWRLRRNRASIDMPAMSLLGVDDAPASTPPRTLTLPRKPKLDHKPHTRDLLYFYHGLLRCKMNSTVSNAGGEEEPYLSGSNDCLTRIIHEGL